ncbi:MAG TPA: VOC family protein [Terriglobales bacterium]|nr:VOC family protein [Terriglobales bacterium]
MKLNTYLVFDGKCAEAFKLYEKVLKGKIVFSMTHGESPMADQTPANFKDKIMHTSLQIGDAVLMGSDAPPQHFCKPQGFSVSINVTDIAEAERIYKELSDGGEVMMPLGETFWAQRFAMFTDKYGTPWMVNCERPRP